MLHSEECLQKPKRNELDPLGVIGFEKYYMEELQNSHCFDGKKTLIFYKSIWLELIVDLLWLYVFLLFPICSLLAREKGSAVAKRHIYFERNLNHF